MHALSYWWDAGAEIPAKCHLLHSTFRVCIVVADVGLTAFTAPPIVTLMHLRGMAAGGGCRYWHNGGESLAILA